MGHGGTLDKSAKGVLGEYCCMIVIGLVPNLNGFV